ncbi:hypothetical protein [Sulfitobacter pontiacus]|uniref:hypothetical protein n=1 Tax=Sulfitobacter pontiacus TaxID=60137 RepID=UPI0021A84C8E|nr:hypothetical protein [Sulfitobacter pontiacus]UWR17529.1 hypothetical protein K3755_07340 [Sulfitobacter pontiacus]
MNNIGILDSYSRRARLLPALITIAPVAVFFAVALPWQSFKMPQFAIGAAIVCATFMLADVARRLGKHAERKLFPTTNGRPFPSVLRHKDLTLDPVLTDKYQKWLGVRLGEVPPSVESEHLSPMLADQFYARCGNWLREQPQQTKRSDLIFEENVTYGFRRNLYGLKPFSQILNLSTAGGAAYLYHKGIDLMWQPAETSGYLVALSVCAVHLAYFVIVVTRNSVLHASEDYGRQLVLSIEALSSNSDAA